ncbi:hypothetical protein ACFL15_02290 [Patescibacteria group bacterium]
MTLENRSIPENKGLIPDKEIITPERHRWFYFSKEKTGQVQVGLENINTGIVTSCVLGNPERDVETFEAWSMARHSRSPKNSTEILHEMVEKDINPQEKAENVINYGHASVRDLATLKTHIENIPMHLAFSIFNNLWANGGQEKSTRFQTEFKDCPLIDVDIVNSNLHPEIKEKYYEIGEYTNQKYKEYQEIIKDRFRQFYKPVDQSQEKTTISRALDSSRVFILMGRKTGMSLKDTPRNLMKLTGELLAAPQDLYSDYAEQQITFFNPPDFVTEKFKYVPPARVFIKHTEKADTANNNLFELKKYLEKSTDLLSCVPRNFEFKGRVNLELKLLSSRVKSSEKMFAQYIISLYPSMQFKDIIPWVRKQDKDTKRLLSLLIFQGHDHHKQMPSIARVNAISAVNTMSLSEAKDLNRQRGLGRFLNIPFVFGLKPNKETIKEILSSGYILPLYISDVKEFRDIKLDMERDLNTLFSKLNDAVELTSKHHGDNYDYSYIYNLLPFSLATKFTLHADPQQVVYFPSLRGRDGGQINYVHLAYLFSEAVFEKDELFFGAWRRTKPDPADREAFFRRN